MPIRCSLIASAWLTVLSTLSAAAAEDMPFSLPEGVRPVWDLARADRHQC